MKPSRTHHILCTSHGLVVEIVFNEDTDELRVHFRGGVPSREAIERDHAELECSWQEIIRQWSSRTGRHSYVVVMPWGLSIFEN